jgi:two-component system response regulator YesN
VLRVALIDDEQLILQGLIRVFPWAKYRCEVIGTACDGREGLRLVREKRPDILMTDIRMPNMDGLSMIAALRSEFPDMKIAVLTAFRDFDYAQRALTLGVCRFLLKPSKMDELYEAFDYMTRGAHESAGEPEAQAGSFVVRQAMMYIRRHYAEHLTLADVAEQVYVSQWHLSKLINRDLGKSFLEVVNEVRIERAKELLADPAHRVNDVALETGFSDAAHFSRNFKKLSGKTPAEFREKTR